MISIAEFTEGYNSTMTLTQKRIFGLLLLMAVAVFVIFIFPNARATENLAMVQMFQPDEAAPLPYVFKMIAPAESLEKALRAFVFYDYYYYGFPFFSLSALTLLPLRWLGKLGEMPLVILLLRQVVSILPMLAALLLLVYMQDGFRTYRSPVLMGFLMTLPAVLWNNFWWHPDGLVVLLVVLVLFFLQRDRLRFGWDFVLAAALTGVVTAAKLVGVYFFLAVGLTLVLGLIKKVSFKRLALMALVYLLVMAISFVAANPFLLSGWARTAYIFIFNKQRDLLAEGYGVVYETGLKAAWPYVRQYYGGAFLILTALGTAIYGAWRGEKRLLSGLILAWMIPLSVMVFFLSHFKFQYWLAVAVPLFSCLVQLLPDQWSWKPDWRKLLQYGLLAGLLVQSVLFVRQDTRDFGAYLQRAETNQRIPFYAEVVEALQPLPQENLQVYYDYRLYVPGETGWTLATNYELLDYGYIQQNNFDVLILLQQRINDYLNPNVSGIDPEQFALNQQFYRDADGGNIAGYRLVFRSEVGLVFVREDLSLQFLGK
jgi:hypothetical protein